MKHFLSRVAKTISIFATIFCLASFAKAQIPAISYASGNKVFTVGTAITALAPTNTGGAVSGNGQVNVTTLAGSGNAAYADGMGTSASFKTPLGVAVDGNGNLYVADADNNRIRKVSPTGVVTTLAGSGNAAYADGTGTAASFYSPTGMSVDGNGNVYVADQINNRIRKISPTGVVTTIAGSGTAAFADGTGIAASFYQPTGLCVDGNGNVYVADYGNNRIRKISSTGVVTTLAGSGNAAYTDGTGSAASFNQPWSVSVDGNGNVYVADSYNNRIRKITPTGVVTTLAGSGNAVYADGTGTAASFFDPIGVSVDGNGNVYVVDWADQRIRKISPTGVVGTLAGNGTQGYADGIGTVASFSNPTGVIVDWNGNVYVGDYKNNRIRKISPVSGYSVIPALPAGLSIDPATGIISGTPTVATASTNYVVTASNASGSSNYTINISTVSAMPSITSFTPTTAATGTTVTIKGKFFTGATAASFGGTAATSYTLVNDSTITAVVGAGASGSISVTTSGGSGSLAGFTYTAIPVITSFTPTLGCAGSTVTIKGKYFTGATAVSFGSTAATSFTVVNDTTITAITSTTGLIKITTSVGTVYSNATYTVGGAATAYAYIANYGSNTASVINTATNTVVATVAVGTNPYGSTVSPDGTKVYVVNTGSNTVSVINTANNTVSATVAVGSGPECARFSPDGSKAYVSNSNDNTISVINTATNTVTATVAVGTTPYGVSISPDGSKVYVVNNYGNTVSVINTATNTVSATIAVGTHPADVCVSPDGSKVYVSNIYSNTVSVINTATNTVSATVAVGSSPYGIVASADGTKIYVTNNAGNSVSVVSAATNTVSATIAVGANPTGISISPDGLKIYVVNNGSNSVSIINTATNTVGTVSVGSTPYTQGSFIANVVTACAPTITSFTPTIAGTGTTVTIKGTSYTGASSVSFGGTAATSFSVVNDTTITAVVGTGASGSVSVITGSGIGSLAGFAYCSTVSSISITSSATALCSGTSVTFTATATNGGTAPSYQWQKGGVNISGATSSTYTYAPANGDMITCVLTANNTCQTTNTATSNSITETVNATPMVSLSSTGGNCTGNVLTLSGVSAGSSIKWNNGGTQVSTASTSLAANGLSIGASQLNRPLGVFVDYAGNIYVSDVNNNQVLKYPAGAGSNTVGTIVAGGNGAGSAAYQLSAPVGIYVDASGNLYIADEGNNRIQKFPAGSTGSTNGITVAGGNGAGSAPNQLNGPDGIFVDALGNIYVGDVNNSRIQKFPAGSTSTTNGITVAGGNGNGSAANQLSQPTGVFVDASGNIYVADNTNNRIQKFPPNSTSATNGVIIAGGNGYGTGDTQFEVSTNVFVDANGNIYVSDNRNARIQKFPAGSTSSTAGVTIIGGNGSGSAANQLNGQSGIFVDAAGNIYVADGGNNRIQKFVTSTPANTYIPGTTGSYTATITSNAGCSATSSAITIAQSVAPSISITSSATTLCSGTSVTFTATATNGGSVPTYQWTKNSTSISGATSNTYTTSALNNNDTIRCVLTANNLCQTASTIISNSIVETVNATPVVSIASSGGNCTGNILTINGASTAEQIIWKNNGAALQTTNQTYGMVGSTVAGGNGSGSAANQLASPRGIFVDKSGNLYIAETFNHRVTKWAVGATSGITVAGGNGAGSASNQLNEPCGVFVDSAGNVYVVDANNYRIQKWAVGATIGTTVAGGNGGGSSLNQLFNPNRVYVDGAGNIYILDYGNHRVVKWAVSASTGVVVAGGNGAGSAATQLNGPQSFYVDISGNIYIADNGNNRIQKWASGANTGTTIAGGNGAGTAANQLNAPNGVYVDANGNLFVADYGNSRVQEFIGGATNGISIASGTNCYEITLDLVGNLYISDQSNNRIQEFTSSIVNTYTPTTAGSYTATATSFAGCSATTSAVTVAQSVTPSVSIAASATSICSGTSVTFTATATSGGTASTYQWYKTGVAISGATATTYSYTPANGDVITCKLTANNTCQITNTTTSNSITETVNTSPVVSLTSTGGNCTGNVLTANGAGNAASLNWYNGSTLLVTASIIPSITGTTVAGGNGAGSGLTQLNGITGVYVDAAGNTYASDWGNNRVLEFPVGSSSSTAGIVVAGGNGKGSAANQLSGPGISLYVDAGGYLYVSDGGNSRIQKFPPNSTSSTNGVTVAGGNGAGSAANQLNNQSGFFVDAIGNIYVADENNQRIQMWAPGATSGVTVAGGNGKGSAANQFNGAYAVSVDANGNIYVCDFGNNRIQKWAMGATTGTTVVGSSTGVTGSSLNLLASPDGLCLDATGNIYVSDQYNQRILKFPPNSTSATNGVVIAGGNGAGSADNQINYAGGICLDGNGNLYIADGSNSRVQKWSAPTSVTTYTPTTAGSYTATATSFAGCSATTSAVAVAQSVTPSVSIAASATSVCSGTSVTFTATATSGGTAPTYQWYKTGVAISGATASFYTYAPTNGDSIYCKLIANNVCQTVAMANSNGIKLTVTPLVTPSITIAQSPTVVCTGGSITLTATPTNGGTAPSYQWYKGSGAIGGATGTAYTYTPANGDSVYIKLTANNVCQTSSTANSSPIIVSLKAYTTASISVTASNTAPVIGSTVTYTATPSTGIVSPVYQWYKNNVIITGATSATYNYAPALGDSLYCNLNTVNNTCQTVAIVKSNVYQTNVQLLTPTLGVFTLPSGTNGSGGSTGAGNYTYGNSPVTLTPPTSNSSGGFTYVSSNPAVATVSASGVVTIVGAGTATITAVQASSGNYASASTPAQTITVAPAAPVVNTLNIGGTQTYGNAPFTLTAPTSNSPGAFTYTSSNTSVATIVGNVVTIVGVGTSTITATQAATTNFTSATATAVLTVVGKTPTLGSFSVASPVNFGSANQTLVAPSSNSTGAFSYTSSNTNVAIISGNILSIVGAGTATITATQAAIGNYATGSATANLTVNAVLPTVTSFTPTSGSAGTVVTITGTFFTPITSVTIGGVPASFTIINATTIQATVGANPTSGNVTVTIANDGSGSLGGFCAIVPPSLSLSVASTDLCSGTSAINFTAIPFNGGTSPTYQWKKNGTVVGSNASTYKDVSPSNGSVITCTMTSSSGCLTTNTATATYTESIIASVTPTITISTPSTSICSGTSVTFIANITNGGLSPSFQWKKNGVNVGANNSLYTDATLTNGSVITCVLTSSATCATATTVTSNSLTMTTTTGAIPAINIYSSNVNVCAGGTVTFFSTVSSVGASIGYQWYKNGVAISGATNATYATNALVPNDAIYCVMTTSNSCSASTTFYSNVVTPNVTNLPTSMAPTVSSTNICKGASVSLSSGFNTNNFTVSSISYNNIAVPVSASTGPAGDDVVGGPYSLPFTFNFFGNSYTNFYISTNGNIQFGPTTNWSYTPGPLPNSSVLNFVALCWSDIVVGSSWNSGPIKYFVDGVAPFRKMVIDWTNCKFYAGTGSFSGQIWLYESTGVVETHLTTAIDNGHIKTTGVNNIDGTIGAAAVNRNGTNWQLSTPEAWRFTPSGNYTCVWSPSVSLNSTSSFTPTATPTDTTTYSLQVTDQVTGCISTGTVKVNVIPSPAIVVTASTTTACSGSPVTFTATTSNAGSSNTFQWKKNGINVGGNSTVYTDATLTNSDSVWCVLTTNATCGTSATSNKVKVAITSNITPTVTAIASNNNICAGAIVTFSANATNGGSPTYQWKKNNVNVGANSASYDDPSLANNDSVWVVMSGTGSCLTSTSVISNKVKISVNANVTPSVTNAASATNICVGGSVTFTATPTNGGTAPAYQWKKNGSIISGATSNSCTATGFATGDSVQAILTANNVCQTTGTVTSNAVKITLNTTSVNTWSGNSSTAWSTAGNWCTGTVPSSGANITVPLVASGNYPVLSSNLTIGNLALSRGAFLSLNGNTLTLTGTTSDSGYIKGSSTSSITVNSTSTPTLYFNPVVNDSLLNTLAISGTGGAKLGSGLGITNLLQLNAGNLNLNGKNLTLKSTSISNTAVIGTVASGATLTGNVTVERFIPKGIKAYRQLSAGGVYNTGSIFANWQEGGRSTAGYGTYITGSASPTAGVNVTTGLDNTTNGASGLYVFPTTTATWTSVTNTKTKTMDPYTGYHVAIFGDRTGNLYLNGFDTIRSMTNVTALRTTGQLVTGTVTYGTSGVSGNFASTANQLATAANGASFIANPYPAIIDWHALAKTGLTSSYSYFDPTYLDASGYQVYVVYNSVTGTNSSPTLSKVNRYIQPGQAFWVQNTSLTSTRQLVITEANKVTDATKLTAIFGNEKPLDRLAISLWKDIEGIGNRPVDGAVAVFSDKFGKQYGDEDSRKMRNPKENLAIVEAEGDLAIDGLAKPKEGEEIRLKLTQLTANTEYRLRIDADRFKSEGLQAYLKDAFLDKQTPIGTEATVYAFTTTGVATETGHRFSIVFAKKATATPIAEATREGKISLYPNPTNGKATTVRFTEMAKGSYRLAVCNVLGQQVLLKTVDHKGGTFSYPLTVPMQKGIATVKLIDETGKSVSQTQLLVD